jgi:hypothetical protein
MGVQFLSGDWAFFFVVESRTRGAGLQELMYWGTKVPRQTPKELVKNKK